ncbi:MAG: glycosyltransferase 87 family protein [Victivallaceae bacterium]
MNLIKKYLKLDTIVNRNFFYMFFICMSVFTLFRIILAFKNNSLVDFVCYVDTATAIWNNLDPYNPHNLKNLMLIGWTSPSIIFPGTFPLSAPFIPFSLAVAKIIHLSLSIIAAYCLVFLFFKKARMLDNFDNKRPDVKAVLILFMAFIFLNSTPVMLTFRHGQNTLFLTLFLVLCLYSPNKWSRIILFSLTAVSKYSMLTLLAPALFLKKNYLFCIVSFLVFLLFAISPALCGNNIIALYGRYAEILQESVSSGFNTYAESGYSMLNIDFFKPNIINILAKLLFGLLGVYIILRDRRRNSFGMNFILTIMCITMLLSYHRLHDINLIMLVLLAEFYFFLLKKDKINISISIAFILFFAVPFSLVIRISHLICKLPHVGDFFQTCHYYVNNIDVFPLPAIVFLLLTIYSLYLYFYKKEEVIFELHKRKPEGAGQS